MYLILFIITIIFVIIIFDVDLNFDDCYELEELVLCNLLISLFSTILSTRNKAFQSNPIQSYRGVP